MQSFNVAMIFPMNALGKSGIRHGQVIHYCLVAFFKTYIIKCSHVIHVASVPLSLMLDGIYARQ